MIRRAAFEGETAALPLPLLARAGCEFADRARAILWRQPNEPCSRSIDPVRIGHRQRSAANMVFSSVIFIFYFLPAFLFFYFVAGRRNAAILTGSVLFYTWGEGIYIVLLTFLIAINLLAGRAIENARFRTGILLFSVGLNLSVLAYFKYANFILNNVSALLGEELAKIDVQLPLGISFFTFQLISYLVDVYRKDVPAERNFVRLSTYILMFPHLIAGPIVRYADIAGEIKSRSFKVQMFGLGVQYFIVGLCQKVIIANSVAPAAEYAFSVPLGELSMAIAWIGAFAYTIQIYFDFCGYSNMAIGLAFMMGFKFPRNFNYPYAAKSISDFWRRWHMSLSFWFRDYVYIPLGGSRGGVAKTIRNLLIVFFLTGLWHGAAWTFIFWGIFHGFFLIMERLWLGRALEKAPHTFARAYVILVVIVGWVFFQSKDFAQATAFLQAMAGFGGVASAPIRLWLTPEAMAALVAGSIFSFPVIAAVLDRLGLQRVSGPLDLANPHHDATFVHQLPILPLLIGFVFCVALIVGNSLNPFLYFRF